MISRPLTTRPRRETRRPRRGGQLPVAPAREAPAPAIWRGSRTPAPASATRCIRSTRRTARSSTSSSSRTSTARWSGYGALLGARSASRASSVPGYEADDVIGTLATQADAPWDRDRYRLGRQGLPSTGERAHLAAQSRARRAGMPWTSTMSRWPTPPSGSACAPTRRRTTLALVGDSADNVPGCARHSERNGAEAPR